MIDNKDMKLGATNPMKSSWRLLLQKCDLGVEQDSTQCQKKGEDGLRVRRKDMISRWRMFCFNCWLRQVSRLREEIPIHSKDNAVRSYYQTLKEVSTGSW